jgi:hypothetical protein
MIPGISSQSPGVRIDLLLSRLAEGVVRGAIEPRLRNVPLWDSGLGEVVNMAIQERVPLAPVTAVDVARRLGILRRRNDEVQG